MFLVLLTHLALAEPANVVLPPPVAITAAAPVPPPLDETHSHGCSSTTKSPLYRLPWLLGAMFLAIRFVNRKKPMPPKKRLLRKHMQDPTRAPVVRPRPDDGSAPPPPDEPPAP
jgi:hypothetical protein